MTKEQDFSPRHGPDGKLHRYTCNVFSPVRRSDRCTCGLPKENAAACRAGETMQEFMLRMGRELFDEIR